MYVTCNAITSLEISFDNGERMAGVRGLSNNCQIKVLRAYREDMTFSRRQILNGAPERCVVIDVSLSGENKDY